jgi:hypothetical protein
MVESVADETTAALLDTPLELTAVAVAFAELVSCFSALVVAATLLATETAVLFAP